MSLETNDYKILQFKQSTSTEYRQRLEREKEVQFISYIPENAWIIKLNDSRGDLTSERKVRFIGPYRAKYKIGPAVHKEISSSGNISARIEFFESSANPQNLLNRYGNVLGRFGDNTWEFQTSSDKINDLATEDGVKFISQKSPKSQTFNYESRNLIGVNTVQSAPYNLKGAGYTAGLWDGGWAGEHPDLDYTSSKISFGDKGENCGSNCEVIGHATHVAGTMLGAGIENYDYRGVASNSSLVTYEWPSGNETELYQETEESITQYGAVISQNSWGYSVDSSNEDILGDYATLAPGYDAIISGNTNQVGTRIPAVFAAGNYGGGFSPRYNTTAGPGATAKNTITVGAVDSGGDMNDFSSWGPTDDGRIKPTVVADGGGNSEYVYSTIPQDNNSNPYGGSAGTSMAAPAVAGSAILLKQKYNQTYGGLPKPSTVKAALIHTAKDINRTGPDYITGWGLVNASSAIDYMEASEDKNLIKTGSVNNGDVDSYNVEVPENETVKFTLVWDDYPASASASKTLVNDLDLVVENGNNDRKYPWTLSWENRTQKALKTQEDHTNPVEQVHVADTQTKQYSIEVEGDSVPEGPQDYSLLMSSKEPSTGAPNITAESPLNKTYSESPDFNLSSNKSLNQSVYSIDGNKNYSMKERDSKYFYNTSANLSEGKYSTTLWGQDNEGNWASDTASFAVDTESPNLSPKNPLKGSNISGIFDINATWKDSTTEVEKANYTISNSTYSESGSLNATFDSTKLEDGSYIVYYNVTDSAGNEEIKQRSINIDNTVPEINVENPTEGSNISDEFLVNSSAADSSGVKSYNITLVNGSGTWTSFSDNRTLDSNSYADGAYSLNFTAEDFAGNIREKSINIEFDNTPPEITPQKPVDRANISEPFEINATWSDGETGVKNSNFTLYNSSGFSFSGSLNSTFDLDGLSDGSYNLSYNASDYADNYAAQEISITLDTQKPSINILSPSENAVASSFDLNASITDENKLDYSNYSITNGTIQKQGNLNTTVDSTRYTGGTYYLEVEAQDVAGNTEKSNTSVKFDNSAPELQSSSIKPQENISGSFDVNASFRDISDLVKAEFRFSNQSGTVTDWEKLNYTGFDSSNLSNGDYNLSIRANDTLGNPGSYRVENLTLDSKSPSLSLTEHNESAEYNGWINNSKKIEAGCSDTGTGVKMIESDYSSSSTSPINFTLTETGNLDFNFTCTDYADNKDLKTLSFKIDGQKPSLKSLSPENNSKTGIDYELTGSFNDEAKESGFNKTASSLNITEGSAEVEWTENSFNASITGLDYSQSYNLEGKLVDNLGHTYSFTASHETENDPDSDENEDSDSSTSSSGGSSGGGFSYTATQVEENNTTEENQTEANQTDNETESSSQEFEEVVAVDPERNTCQTYNESQVPEGWEKVESCSAWKEQRAQELIEQIRGEDDDTVSRAESALDQGDYDRAIEIASSANQEERKENKSEESGILLIFALAGLAAILIGIAVIAVHFYRRKKLMADINGISKELIKFEQKGVNNAGEESIREIEKAESAIKNKDYRKARNHLENFKELK